MPVAIGWILVLIRGGGQSDLPEPPEKYFAPVKYDGLSTEKLVGRTAELERLREWICRDDDAAARVFIVQAIGGQGKSALTSTWFEDLKLKAVHLRGAMWWRFEDQSAIQTPGAARRDEAIAFDKFLTHALAYMEKKTVKQIAEDPTDILQQRIGKKLKSGRFLLVFDGFERLMTLYTSTMAANPREEDIMNAVASGNRHKREAADLRVGDFLRLFAKGGKSRILITSRLPPADLEKREGGLRAGCELFDLQGLTNPDALEFWHELGAGGTPAEIQKCLRSFENHPLLIQILAGEVKSRGGNFDEWHKDNPGYLPTLQVEREEGILSQAFSGLSTYEPMALQALYVTATFPPPALLSNVVAALIWTQGRKDPTLKPFANEQEVRDALKTLQARGLLGGREVKPQLELHPIVRDNARKRLSKDPATQKGVFERVKRVLEKQVGGNGDA